MKKKTTTPSGDSRRSFLKKAGLGGLSAGLLLNESIHEQLEYLTQKVNRNGVPSELKITDMRIAEISGVVFRTPIVRIYTNQGKFPEVVKHLHYCLNIPGISRIQLVDIYNLLGICHIYLNEFMKAEAMFEKAANFEKVRCFFTRY